MNGAVQEGWTAGRKRVGGERGGEGRGEEEGGRAGKSSEKISRRVWSTQQLYETRNPSSIGNVQALSLNIKPIVIIRKRRVL